MEKLLLVAFCILALTCSGPAQSFNANFEIDASGFIIGKSDTRNLYVKKGQYHLDRKDPNTGSYTYIKVSESGSKNFTIETQMTQIKGPTSEGFGIRIAKYNNSDNYRYFYISSNKKIKIGHFYKEKQHTHVDWEFSSLVNETGKPNRLKVERVANILRYYINDSLFYQHERNSYFGSKFGFFVSGESHVVADYFNVTTCEITQINLIENPIEDLEIINMGPGVNTELEETAAFMSTDGKRLYYVRKKDPNNFGAEKYADIYYSTLDSNGNYTSSTNLGRPINNEGKNSLLTILPDNNTMLLMNRYNEDGTPGGSGISTSTRGVDGWKKPVNWDIENIDSHGKYAGYSLSPSGNVLVMQLRRSENLDHADLWVSFLKENNTWTEPKNLGPQINTIGDEWTPFISSDGKTLYFSSDGHYGYGGKDLFISRRLDDTWTNWSKPQNLGKGINSPKGEFSFVIDGKGEYGFLTIGKKGGFGKGDIYKVKLSENARPENVVYVKGRVTDSKTKSPLESSIEYELLTTGEVQGKANSDGSTGAYGIVLNYGESYAFRAKKEGYYPISFNIDLTKKGEYKEITRDLELAPIEQGMTVVLNNIFFEVNKAELKAESEQELQRLVNFLTTNKYVKVEIGGHTDSDGNDQYNQTLSQKRANSVMKFLTEHGIDSDNVSAKGYGEAQPMQSNDTEEGKAKNRRVEFKILSVK